MTGVEAPGCATCAGPLDRVVSRRRALQGAGVLAGAVAAGALSTVAPRYAFASPDSATAGDALVVITLRGGFDGLSAVVPAADPDYRVLRPGIGVPAAALLPLDATFGLHPSLRPLLPLWAQGQLAVVHAVGSPLPSRSHFEAQLAMERAAFGTGLSTGWLGRWVAASGATDTFAGVAQGSTVPLALAGPKAAVAMRSPETFALNVWSGFQPRFSAALAGLQAGVSHPVAGSVSTTLAALGTMGQVAASPYTPASGASYPTGDLGDALRDAARLIKAGIGVRVVTLDVDGWDMHEGLGGVDGGRMREALAGLAAALAAFAADTGLVGVTVVTQSEFGRQVAENSSGGVDHGRGGATLVLGQGVRGGRVYGRWPGLTAAALDDGDLAATTDYRAVLAELLADRCGASSDQLATVFPGFGGALATPLDLARPL